MKLLNKIMDSFTKAVLGFFKKHKKLSRHTGNVPMETYRPASKTLK